MFFAAVLRLAGKHFFADAAIMDNMAQLQRKKRKGEKKKEKTRAVNVDGVGGEENVHKLWGMLYICRRGGHCITITRRV